MQRKLTAFVARHPIVVATFAVVVVAAAAAAVGDAATAVDPATLGTATENGTLVEPMDGGGGGGPTQIGDGDG